MLQQALLIIFFNVLIATANEESASQVDRVLVTLIAV